ncbi:MAG: CapA family protein [Anaerolineae bacterium]|nr:CapA family protein [Anaerolineae bacterium]MCZ7552002.1 CapA family protein [Anaerolineales bacterium]
MSLALFQTACQSGSAAAPVERQVSPEVITLSTSSPTPAAIPATHTTTLLPSSTHTATLLPPSTAEALPTAKPSLTPSLTPTAEPLTTTLIFTGIIVPARCVQAKLDEIGNPDYPYEEVRETLSAADLTVGVFNATMSDRVEHTGCLTTWQLVGSPDNAGAAARAGFDLMGVATNHIKDCGLMKSWCDYAFFDTLANLQRAGIQTVGAGADLEAALQPVVFTRNGVRFGFVSLGDSKMDPVVFAGEDHPGIAHLIPENMKRAIELARQSADVVIAMPHWGSEDIAIPNWNQQQQARQLIEYGADLIVGNHTHVVQAIQELDGVPVFYGLGNFVFDQGLRDHRQGIILLVDFKGSQYLGYRLIPTHTDADGRVHIADPEEAAEILESIARSSAALP